LDKTKEYAIVYSPYFFSRVKYLKELYEKWGYRITKLCPSLPDPINDGDVIWDFEELNYNTPNLA
jgi:hypothetical protein